MGQIILSLHAQHRLNERGISVHEVKKIAKSDQVIKYEKDGSLIKTGICSNTSRPIIVICIQQGRDILIKTAYYEDFIR